MVKVFIDGSAGTTGLRIYDRLSNRKDIQLLRLPDALRKYEAARRDMLNAADVAFLCLPDAAALEAASWVENPDTAVIDTSTAHRTDPGWVYGFPELAGQRERILASKRIANPGCHASGFIALVAPLRHAGLLPAESFLSCTSLTGYSGGGKKMIAEYEAKDRSPLLDAPRAYGLSQSHKHLPEMQKLCGLKEAPGFLPVVADFYSGMEVSVVLPLKALGLGLDGIREAYRAAYPGPVVRYREAADEGGFLSAAACAGYDDMEITVHGNEERALLTARFDNLGKGASGAAIQNMNLLLGVDETTGLMIREA